jgi:hypothetical protein
MRAIILLIGALWPFIIAGVFLGLLSAQLHLGDGAAYGLFLVSFFGTPAVAWGAFCFLPRTWDEGVRLGTAIALSMPIGAASVFFALVAVGMGMLRLGAVPV